MYQGYHSYQQYFHRRPDPKTLNLMHRLRTSPHAAAVVAAALGEGLYENRTIQRGMRPTSGAVCPLRLIGRHCRREACPCQQGAMHAIFDHRELYIKNGRATLFVSHPYVLNGKQAATLQDFCERHGLVAMISAASWYFAGHTMLVEIRRVAA